MHSTHTNEERENRQANHNSHKTALSQATLHLRDIKMSLALKGGQLLGLGVRGEKLEKGLRQVITSCKPYARTICLTHNTYTHLKMGYLAEKTQLSIKTYDN